MIRFLFLFTLVIITSCTYNELPKVVCIPDEQVYFELVQPIIENNCISCHSTTGQIFLESNLFLSKVSKTNKASPS